MNRTPAFRLALLFIVLWATAPGFVENARAEASAADIEQRVSRTFDGLRDQPERLAIFLRAMPKGGDLHMHLDGAVYAERMIDWAAADGLCVDRTDLALVPPPCAEPLRPPASAALQDAGLHARVVDALSMRHFVDGPDNGHDHFFGTFRKFSGLQEKRSGDMTAELASQAAAEHTAYLEIMWSPGMKDARALAADLPVSEDFEALTAKLLPSIRALVPQVRQWVDGVEQRHRALLGCDTPEPQPGCAVTLRYQAQVIRTFPLSQVFAQALLAHLLVIDDPRFVGVNFVAPEDDALALRDYHSQMRLLGYLHSKYPAVKLSLHAGELAPGLVPPGDLRFHIREAVEIAHALRIGHGVDVASEDDAPGLLAEMAARSVLVEINLTSNDLILGVRGPDHPFEIYRRAGVKLALSTDDQGVSRIDLTHEYVRAAETYHLGYRELKQLARDSLEYAFLAGASLGQSAAPCGKLDPQAALPPGACRELIAQSDKARVQWATEAAFRRFESSIMTANP